MIQPSRFLTVLAGLCLAGCVTSRVEDARENVTGLKDGESVVIMVKSYHQGNETEGDYLSCIEKALGNGSEGLTVVPHQDFVDQLFPWFQGLAGAHEQTWRRRRSQEHGRALHRLARR